MQIIIGGSPSTGSSLLRQLLNRHSAIYCGPETKLFAYPQLFEDWSKYRWGLVKPPLITAPDVHLIRGSNLSGAEQKASKAQVEKLIAESKSLPEFAGKYFEIPCDHYGKTFWADKTPANVLTFRAFESAFDKPLVVHMIRDPLDTITSLRHRGLSLLQAVSRYLFSTSYGLAIRESACYVEVRYEELAHDPEAALSDLFARSGLAFEPQMMSKGNAEMTETSRMEGWTHRETDRPRVGAVGRFNRLDTEQKDEILQAISCMAISDQFAMAHGLKYLNVNDIAQATGYVLPLAPAVDTAFRLRLKRERLAKMMMAFAQRSAFWAIKRPIVVR